MLVFGLFDLRNLGSRQLTRIVTFNQDETKTKLLDSFSAATVILYQRMTVKMKMMAMMKMASGKWRRLVAWSRLKMAWLVVV